MKIITLGAHSAFAVGEYRFEINEQNDVYAAYVPKWQSNFLIEFDAPGKIKNDVYRLLFDFGSDIRHSLAGKGLKMSDIDALYCSHPHADHIGGIEGIALSTFFNPFWNAKKQEWVFSHAGKADVALAIENSGLDTLPYNMKPTLYAHSAPVFEKDVVTKKLALSSVMRDLWNAARPGLETLQGSFGMNVQLDTYFDLQPLFDNTPVCFKDGDRHWNAYTVVSTHVMQGTKMMASYGLMLECSDGKKVFMPSDTQLMAPPQIETFYKRADVIYQDCETGPRSNVHPHIEDLKQLDPMLKKKLYLYHYTSYPDVDDKEFRGVLEAGDVHEY